VRGRVQAGLEQYAVPLITAATGVLVALIGGLLKIYNDSKVIKSSREDKEDQGENDVKKQSMLSADEQIKLLWRSNEQKDAVILSQQAQHTQDTIDLADARASNPILAW
jgi:hypothetical protein